MGIKENWRREKGREREPGKCVEVEEEEEKNEIGSDDV